MAVSRCPNGHFYDDAAYPRCPHCADHADRNPDSVTMAMNPPAARADGDQSAAAVLSGMVQDERTVGIYRRKMKADPVVGWLVCVEGAERGRDYRLHTGRNFLGRSMKMDVALADDAQVSRENHGSIVYEPLGNAFSLMAGEGTAVYHNGELIAGPVALTESDTIRVGGSTLVFIPFCREERKWL